jgi:hypothetical protein
MEKKRPIEPTNKLYSVQRKLAAQVAAGTAKTDTGLNHIGGVTKSAGDLAKIAYEFTDTGYPLSMYNESPRLRNISMFNIWTKDLETRVDNYTKSNQAFMGGVLGVFVGLLIASIYC